MKITEEISFPPNLELLHDMLSFIYEKAGEAGLDAAVLEKAELAAEEAIVNIIEHGRPSFIAISCTPMTLGVAIAIKDDGPPFDPTALSARKHGHGLWFLHTYADTVEYQRGQFNELTLCFSV